MDWAKATARGYKKQSKLWDLVRIIQEVLRYINGRNPMVESVHLAFSIKSYYLMVRSISDMQPEAEEISLQSQP